MERDFGLTCKEFFKQILRRTNNEIAPLKMCACVDVVGGRKVHGSFLRVPGIN